jgi:NAD(P)H-dependent nitrite reductase small subunit
MIIESDGFVEVCSINELKEKQGKRFLLNDVEVAVFKVEGNIYAVSNICPHQHTALIFEGIIEEGCVICPVHGWTFHLQTGRKQSGSKGLETYPVIVKDGKLFVRVFKKELNW